MSDELPSKRLLAAAGEQAFHVATGELEKSHELHCSPRVPETCETVETETNMPNSHRPPDTTRQCSLRRVGRCELSLYSLEAVYSKV